MAFIEPTIYSHNTQNNTDFAVTLIDSMRHSWYMWSVWNEDILQKRSDDRELVAGNR